MPALPDLFEVEGNTVYKNGQPFVSFEQLNKPGLVVPVKSEFQDFLKNLPLALSLTAPAIEALEAAQPIIEEDFRRRMKKRAHDLPQTHPARVAMRKVGTALQVIRHKKVS